MKQWDIEIYTVASFVTFLNILEHLNSLPENVSRVEMSLVLHFTDRSVESPLVVLPKCNNISVGN